MVRMWRSEAILCESALSFYLVSLGTGSQVISLGCKLLYLLRHLVNPKLALTLFFFLLTILGVEHVASRMKGECFTTEPRTWSHFVF